MKITNIKTYIKELFLYSYGVKKFEKIDTTINKETVKECQLILEKLTK